MEIKTKFDIGQEVYIVFDDKSILKGEIIGLMCIVGLEKNFVHYECESNGFSFEEMEENVFLTKEEAEQKLREIENAK